MYKELSTNLSYLEKNIKKFWRLVKKSETNYYLYPAGWRAIDLIKDWRYYKVFDAEMYAKNLQLDSKSV